ncbi:MAG: DUF2460 domain-containing protein [Alphaproteobacteria bacterium]|nr:DUF2460 domain-containing protein [Alphaproteobacteria bacterium]
MGFVEVQFPTDISYGSSGGPEYATDVVTSSSGHEQRNINWEQARARYNVAHGVKTKAQLDALIAFFRARKGRAYGFRFKDWTDYQATETLGMGDGVQTQFQLVKSYTSGDVTETRLIRKPVSGSVQVYQNAVLQSAGMTIDSATGMVVFAVPPAAGQVITASFEFDVPVRFDTDRLSSSLDAYGIHSWLDIPLLEVRA